MTLVGVFLLFSGAGAGNLTVMALGVCFLVAGREPK